MYRRRVRNTRRGGVIVPVAVSLTVIVGMAAVAVDLSRLNMVRAQLQACADAAALAGDSALLRETRLRGTTHLQTVLANARVAVADFVQRNPVMGRALSIDPNHGNNPTGDIVIGYLSNPADRTAPLVFTDPNRFNSIRVRVRCDDARNGAIALTFARLLGHQRSELGAAATATFPDGVVGFRVTQRTGNAQLLPFALHENRWATLMQTAPNSSNDKYTYNPDTGAVSCGSDGIPELNMYPGSGATQLPPGNFGTVDIGNPNNSTADLARQIRYGVNAADLAYLGGELRLGPDGTLRLNGDTGLSAGIKDDLAAVRGQPRAIPIFRSVSGQGNNTYFTVTGFVGIRIMAVQLTGSMSNKHVLVQPAMVVDDAAITQPGGNSTYVYGQVMLSR